MIRAELQGDALFIWVTPEVNREAIRTAAARFCADLYKQGIYVVPIVLEEHR